MDLVRRRVQNDRNSVERPKKASLFFSKFLLQRPLAAKAVTLVFSTLVAIVSPSISSLFEIRAAIAQPPAQPPKNKEKSLMENAGSFKDKGDSAQAGILFAEAYVTSKKTNTGAKDYAIKEAEKCINAHDFGNAVKIYLKLGENDKPEAIAKKFEQNGELDYAIELYKLTKNKEKIEEINDRIIKIISDYYKNKGDHYSAGLGYAKLFSKYDSVPEKQKDRETLRKKILEMAELCEKKKDLFSAGFLYIKIGETVKAGIIAYKIGERIKEKGNLVFGILLYSDLNDGRVSELKENLIKILNDRGLNIDLNSDESREIAFAEYFKMNGNPYEAGLRFAQAYYTSSLSGNNKNNSARENALEMADLCEKKGDYYYAGDILISINNVDNPKKPEVAERLGKLARFLENDNLGTARKLYIAAGNTEKRNEMCVRMIAELKKAEEAVKSAEDNDKKKKDTWNIGKKPAEPLNEARFHQITEGSIISATDLNPRNWISLGLRYNEGQLTIPNDGDTQVSNFLLAEPELKLRVLNRETAKLYLTGAYDYEKVEVNINNPDHAFHATSSAHVGLLGLRLSIKPKYGILALQARGGVSYNEDLNNNNIYWYGAFEAQVAYVSPHEYFTLIASGNLDPYMPSGLILEGKIPIKWVNGQQIVIEISGTTRAIAVKDYYSKNAVEGRTEKIVTDFFVPAYYYKPGKNPNYYFGFWLRPQAEFVQASGVTGTIVDITVGAFAKIGPAQLMAGYSAGTNMVNLSLAILGDWDYNNAMLKGVSVGARASWYGIARKNWEREILLKAGLLR